MKRETLISCLSVACLASCLAPAAEKPNLIVILADDQGYADVGCYGAKAYCRRQWRRMAPGKDDEVEFDPDVVERLSKLMEQAARTWAASPAKVPAHARMAPFPTRKENESAGSTRV